jgi:hypothetical protein
MHATITPLQKPKQASRNLTQEIEDPGQNAASDLTQQPLQLTLKRGHVLGRGVLLEELIDQLGAIGQRA